MAKANIMIVEDDAIIAMDIENQLKQLGYGVSAIVGYGEQAIEKVKENTSDLVLMDIVLKGEIDGIEAAEEIRTQFDIPVVFLTAFAEKNRLKRAKLAYPFGFILKPFQNKDLSVTIEMALYVAKVDVERRKAGEALESERDKLRSLMDGLANTGIGVDIVSAEYEILQQNQTLVDRFGNIVGKKCYQEYMALEEPCSFCPMVQALENKRLERVELQGADERDYEILSAPLTNPDGTTDRAIEVVIDITERKRTEETLRESEEKYKSLTNNLNVGVYRNTAGSEGKFIEANPAIVQMFGYDSRDEFLEVSVSDLYQNQGDREEYNANILKEGAVRNEELQLRKKDGTLIICSVSAVVVRDEQGEVKYYDGIIEDISKRKLAEEDLRDSEKKSSV